jgi:galactose-1-phosphate uridylyltransferase
MELCELTTVPADTILEHEEDCPFCKSNEKEKPANPVSKDDNDLEEDSDARLIRNSSGELDQKMAAAKAPRPHDWFIDMAKIGGRQRQHQVIANPHHLIPGNESLKKATELLPWIFGNKGKIENDIGYNVNNASNGVWLPSNNGMRGNAKWRNGSFKGKYVVLAMDKARHHFHDRHANPYSASVTEILNKIAERMNGIDARAKCPYKTEKGQEGLFKPPYALVARLNGVSARLRGYLAAGAGPQASFYTSKLVLRYWLSKGMATDEAGVLE